MNIRFPLAAPSWGDEEVEAMQKVITSGNFSMGKNVLEFEAKFAEYMGSKYSVMVNSGSSANLLMVAALFYRKELSLKRGDEVIVPAVGWSTSYFPLYQYGLKICFVDIDIETLNFNLEQLEAAITTKTKAILAINLLGNPNNFDSINQIIKGKEIIVIEDNCESMDATFKNKKAGTFGLMGTFSTFHSHHISTMEGGLIVTDNEELYHILLSIRSHGWTRNLPKSNLVCSEKSEDFFKESFRFVLPGYNVRPLEMEGAIGIEQLKKLPGLIIERRKNSEKFKELLQDHPHLMIQKEIGSSSWFGFSLIIRKESHFTRKELINKLYSLGFESRPIVTGNFASNEVVKYFDYDIKFKLENAEYISANGLFIGNQNFPMTNAFELIGQIR
jgi:CDP-4-dehydro-6-deoxyglucose reductase, E1